MEARLQPWRDRWRRWRRPARDGAILACAVFVIGLAMGVVPLAVDAHAYWAADPSAPYHPAHLGQFDAYFYSPAFVQLLTPLQQLPWPIFAATWTVLLCLALFWLGGPDVALLLLLPPVFIELAMGNVDLLLAVAVALGFRFPAAWAFILLTKVTPGVGLLWFVVRREWRSLAIALGATVAVTAVSFVLDPGLWGGWIAALTGTGSQVVSHQTDIGTLFGLGTTPLVARLAIAAAVVVWGGLTDRRWTVPVAATLALPVIWFNGLAVLLALVPMARGGRVGRTGAPVSGTVGSGTLRWIDPRT